MVRPPTVPLLLLAALLAAARLPAAPPGAEVVSVDELRAAGVSCRPIALQALTASVEIDVVVDAAKTPGAYEGAECVVLKTPVPAEELAAADAATGVGDAVARRARSNKPKAEFLVLGREVARAYLAFTFRVPLAAGGSVRRRYLLPVSAIGRRAEPPASAAAPREASFLQ